MNAAAPAIAVQELLERYDALLIDAYGVLVHGGGPLPGAGDFLRLLDERGIPWLVVTNDASKLPEVAEARYAGWGLPIPAERIVASGSLLVPWFRQHGLRGAPTCVLGPAGSQGWGERAGAALCRPDDPAWEVLAICDEALPEAWGMDLLAAMDSALTVALRRLDAGLPVHLVAPNPDLIYTKGPGSYGFAAGTLARAIRDALALRHGDAAPAVQWLGKPFAPIFESALARLGAARPVMLGDQLATDVRGALGVGIDAVLVGSGVGRATSGDVVPTWTLSAVDPVRR